jgi:hypothetical protein
MVSFLGSRGFEVRQYQTAVVLEVMDQEDCDEEAVVQVSAHIWVDMVWVSDRPD